MLKEKAVASLGQPSLLMPAWIQSALAANDRLKLYLTLLQSAAQRASTPDTPTGPWEKGLARTELQDAPWARELVGGAYCDDDLLILPHLENLLEALSNDLTTMARPLCDTGQPSASALTVRRDHWLQQLHALADDEGLRHAALTELTHGDRQRGDSLHLLVMDLHRQINALSSELATEDIDGAHAWQVQDDDRPLIRAFMRGLHRTAALKFLHPGLDTAVTRNGQRLLIQNDIGTNDVHVLVIAVQDSTISLTYSDLHPGRFGFFRQMLEDMGFAWQVFDPRVSDGLNAGKPYLVGQARLEAQDSAQLQTGLDNVASRIVFVIDWNRARKRLQHFVSKARAIELLTQAARNDWGHMAWLLAGADHLVYNAMQAVDSEAFHVGDRLDDVLGEAAASAYLLELLRISSMLLRQQQPVSLVADEARLLLARVLRQRTFEFDLLAEHAAFTHALAEGLCDALENPGDAAQTQAQVLRAKNWERQADHLLMDARQRAERRPRWLPVVDCLAQADDVADALEEATFMHSLTLIHPAPGLPTEVRAALCQLAATTLSAIQDLVKAIEIARQVSQRADGPDSELFLQTLWRMLRAERQCDDLFRQARTTMVKSLRSAPVDLMLANDLAATLEKATDKLLRVGYALRQMVFNKTGMSA
ncbi:hypothetical protein [Acidovorax sp. JHL-9]|uniref:hypothetical protein n=1 Tax=Acidovorax sp. JHL-9 TaxID=1276756 RepID=UPI00041909BE|nr:hypothetical protein [Acidovorax sp. JHL-9]